MLRALRSPRAARAARPALLALLFAALLPACVVLDVRAGEGESGVTSTGFIGGYATAGWPADDSILKVALFDGPNSGAILYVQIWKLVRAEVGFLGAAVGVGPLDAGFGVLLYCPQPPRYEHAEEEKAAPAKPAAPTEPAKPAPPAEPAPPKSPAP